MRIEAPSPEDVAEVVRNMRAKDRAELLATMKHVAEDACEDLFIWTFAGEYKDSTFCAYLDDEPIAVGALVAAGDNKIDIGMVATEDFPRIAFAMTKFVRKRLLPKYAEMGFKRVEAASVAGYDEAHRWIETLGLKRIGVLEGVGRGGEDFIHFGKDLT